MSSENSVFGNPIRKAVIKKALKSKQKYIRKFSDDSDVNYPLTIRKNEVLGDTLGVYNIEIGEAERKTGELEFDREEGLIVGNIRMGFGHYRISMAIASAAHALGYTPYWMDLNSYQQTTGGKVIAAQNDLYSLGSRISQKSRLFNHFIWEPINYEGFRKLSYNVSDQKNAELMTSVFRHIPKEIPFVGTHVWPAQAAVHAHMKSVVNAIPDNWPMALHLSQGSLHTVQTHFAYQGYRILNGMDKTHVLHPMGESDIAYTGHYIDYELVSNIDADCDRRIKRKKTGKAMRFLLTIGGAGAQKEIFSAIIKRLLPDIISGKAVLYVNVGDYANVWEELQIELPDLKKAELYFDDWEKTRLFCEAAITNDVTGIHAFCHKNIFEAVYTTNLLMRSCDVLVTKPSELSFYPVPKLFIRRVGGHEKWGAIHSAEVGDGTLECRDIPHTLQMIDLFLQEEDILCDMCENIKRNHKNELYSGAMKVVELAAKGGKTV